MVLWWGHLCGFHFYYICAFFPVTTIQQIKQLLEREKPTTLLVLRKREAKMLPALSEDDKQYCGNIFFLDQRKQTEVGGKAYQKEVELCGRMRTNWILLLSLIKWNWICWFQSAFWISFNAQVIFQAHHANLLVKRTMIDIFPLILIWNISPLFWKYISDPNLEAMLKSGSVLAGICRNISFCASL